jgi:N12 class adenine-specific DNA methylase
MNPFDQFDVPDEGATAIALAPDATTGDVPTAAPQVMASALPAPAPPKALVDAVIHEESRGNANARNPRTGASGLMQIMPQTGLDPGFGVKPITPDKLFDPDENRRFGTEYLDAMLKRYQGDLDAALVAYNWGPKNADQWVRGGRDINALPRETRNYVRNIKARLADTAGPDTGAALPFAARSESGSTLPQPSPNASAATSNDLLRRFLTARPDQRRAVIAREIYNIAGVPYPSQSTGEASTGEVNPFDRFDGAANPFDRFDGYPPVPVPKEEPPKGFLRRMSDAAKEFFTAKDSSPRVYASNLPPGATVPNEMGEAPAAVAGAPAGDWIKVAPAIGSQIADAALYHLGGSIGAALTGAQSRREDPDWAERQIQRSRERSKEVAEKLGKGPTGIPGYNWEDIASLGPSLASSVAPMVAGVATGLGTGAAATAATSPVGGAVAGWTAGSLASGLVAYKQAVNQFVNELRDHVDAERKAKGQGPISDAEFNAKLDQIEPLIREYGLWEAVPETASNVLTLGVLKAPVKSAIGKVFGHGIATRLASKAGAVYAGELGTETITQQGQHNVEVEAGMKPAERKRSWLSAEDLGESFREIAPLTVLQTTLMAGGTKGAMVLADRIRNRGLTPQQYNELMALNDRVERGEIDPQQAREQALQLIPPPAGESEIERAFRRAAQGDATASQPQAEDEAVLRQMGWTAEDIAEMTPTERAAEITAARRQGIVPTAAPVAPMSAAPATPAAISGSSTKSIANPPAPIDHGTPDRAPMDQPWPAGAVPEASGPEAVFRTSRGSTYVLHGDATTTRNKAYRPEHGAADQGLQPRSQLTVFLSPHEAQALAPPQGAPWTIVAHGDGTVSLATRGADGGWGIAPSQRQIRYATVPQPGMIPLELWDEQTIDGHRAFRRAHFGNDITDVRRTAAPAAGESEIERIFRDAEAAPAARAAPAAGESEIERILRDAASQGDGTRTAPIKIESDADLARAATVASTDYTPQQGEANNRQLGHIEWHGLQGSIEVPAGGLRRGIDPQTGKPWATVHTVPYGYWKDTKGADGMHVDAYFGPEMSADHPVYVLDEINPATGEFRQHKTFVGFANQDAVRQAYLGTSTKTPEMIGGITALPLDEFKAWLAHGDMSRPFAAASQPSLAMPSSVTPEPSAAAQRAQTRSSSAAQPQAASQTETNQQNAPQTPSKNENQAVPAAQSALSAKARKALAELKNGATFVRRLERNPATGRDQFRYRLLDRDNRPIKGFGLATFLELDKAGLLQIAAGGTSTSTFHRLSDRALSQTSPSLAAAPATPPATPPASEPAAATATAPASEPASATAAAPATPPADAPAVGATDQQRPHDEPAPHRGASSRPARVETITDLQDGSISAGIAAQPGEYVAIYSWNGADDRQASAKALAELRERYGGHVVVHDISDARRNAYASIQDNMKIEPADFWRDMFAAGYVDELRDHGRVVAFRESAMDDLFAVATSEAGSKSSAPSRTQSIDDVGEKIGGARKDLWAARGLTVTDLDGMTGAEIEHNVTKQNVFPAPDYVAMVANGLDPFVAAAIRRAYNNLPARPHVAERGRGHTTINPRTYVQALGLFRSYLQTVTAIGDPARTVLADGFRAFLRQQPASTFLTADQDDILRAISKPIGRYRYLLPGELSGKDLADARDDVRNGWPAVQEAWQKYYVIDTQSRTGEAQRFALRRRVASAPPDDKARSYDRWEDAVARARELADSIATSERSTEGQLPSRPHLDRVVRDGPDYRKGRNVTGQDFIDTFGFRAVEFGNWVASDERQKVVNLAFDALHDLARVLGVAPQAMSLDGSLALAFGARGTGGMAGAHYEPGRRVVNMTKLTGAGSLAHEWGHALDHYLGEIHGPDPYKAGVRSLSGWRRRWKKYDLYEAEYHIRNFPPRLKNAAVRLMAALHVRPATAKTIEAERAKRIAEAEQALRDWKTHRDRLALDIREGGRAAAGAQKRIAKADQAIAWWQERLARWRSGPARGGPVQTEYFRNAKKLSGKSGEDGYWARPNEMFARAFEAFVFDQIAAEGLTSQYLVQGVEPDRFASDVYRGNPYPTGSERKVINEAFARLLRAIEAGPGKVGAASRLFGRPGEVPDQDTQPDDYPVEPLTPAEEEKQFAAAEAEMAAVEKASEQVDQRAAQQDADADKQRDYRLSEILSEIRRKLPTFKLLGEETDRALALYDEGLSIEEIAERLAIERVRSDQYPEVRTEVEHATQTANVDLGGEPPPDREGPAQEGARSEGASDRTDAGEDRRRAIAGAGHTGAGTGAQQQQEVGDERASDRTGLRQAASPVSAAGETGDVQGAQGERPIGGASANGRPAGPGNAGEPGGATSLGREGGTDTSSSDRGRDRPAGDRLQPATVDEFDTIFDEVLAEAFASPSSAAQPAQDRVDIGAAMSKPPLERTDAENRALLEHFEAKRVKTAGDERTIALLRRRIEASPDKWRVGDGVGYRVDRQINRGFRIVSIDPNTKTAVVRSVADTGLTTTGGADRIADTTVHIGDLVRDRKYDAERSSQSGAELAQSALRNVTSAADDALTALTILFGGNKVSMGPTFDEETWAKAKPLFLRAADKFADAAADIRELLSRLINELRTVHGWTEDMFRAARPYIRRFADEVRSGDIKLYRPRSADQSAKQESIARAARTKRNYHISKEDRIGEGSPRQKIEGNIAAIRMLKEIEEAGREATDDEKRVLVRYVGWGAFAQDVFSEHKPEWADHRAQLRDLLTRDELNAARASTLNAHYTSPDVIRGMWTIMLHLGFEGGRALEPAAGVGHFIGLQPKALAVNTQWSAVELDDISGRIAKLLYPGADVQVRGFETFDRPLGFYDIAISNVPFGSYQLHDPKRRGYLIHDYFFIKSLDLVRPGGIVAFVTSSGTMDKQADRARKEIAKRADLLGSIRLPGGRNGAFAKNAGTEVTTDIIILRRRGQGEPEQGHAWMDLVPIQTPDGPIEVNEYFAAHPDMMLGEMRLSGTMYRSGMPELIGPTDNLAQRIAEAGTKLPSQVIGRRSPAPAVETTIDASAADGVKEGAFYIKDGTIYQKRFGAGVAVTVKPNDRARLELLIEIRDTINDLLALQASGAPDPKRAELLRGVLNTAYDRFAQRFGPINLTKLVTINRKNSDGRPLVIRRMPNLSVFKEDPDAYKVAAIEQYDEDTGKATKAAVFSTDIIAPDVIPQVASPADALAVSLNRFGRVDIPEIAKLLSVSEDEAVDMLGDRVYLDPSGDVWRTAEEYLSGDVVQKLEDAEQAAQSDPQYHRNVEALRRVQPPPLTRVDIRAVLGAPWIPRDIYETFINDELGGDNVKLGHNPISNGWAIISGRLTQAAITRWSTERLSAVKAIEAALNMTPVRIVDEVTRPEGTVTAVVNEEATKEAQVRIDELRTLFHGDLDTNEGGWVWADEDRAARLEAIYNRHFNRLVTRTFDGSHLTFPGLAKEITLSNGKRVGFRLYPHQRNAVWRILSQGNTLLAHVVGAGKTFTMIAAGMEMKRLGQIQRPMYVVPNHMLEQFSREFLQAYPGARVLVADKDRMSRANRTHFAAQIAAERWDAIIITHDAFGRMPVSDEFYRQFLTREIDVFTESIRQAKQDEGAKSQTVKHLERMKKRRQARMEALLNRDRKDVSVRFEELGVDFLFVDEAHLFKNLSFMTKMQRIKGLGQGDAQRATDLFLKIQLLEQRNPGRSVVFATGTPVSNTIAEMYTMQRYLQHDRLREYGIEHFDAWAASFGQVVTQVELSADGRSFRETSAFSRFVNMPELISIYSEVADVQTANMLNLPRPRLRGGAVQVVEAEPSAFEEAYITNLVRRAEAIRRAPPRKGADNMLKIVTEGRKVATDGRLISPHEPINPHGKIALAVANIHRIWRDGKDPAMAQIVFLDLGVPRSRRAAAKPSPADNAELDAVIDDDQVVHVVDIDEAEVVASPFNLYADLRDRLVAAGIPREQIAFIHEATDDLKKATLFQAVRDGTVRVLIGSTGKMGVGTNVQTRLVAMHHLDAPWKPAEVEQRDGRILRQGNLNDEVEIYRYITKRSFDSFMWQTLERKARFLSQLTAGARGARIAEDVDDPLPEAAQLKAAASGDPRIIEHAELSKLVRDLEAQKRSHEQTIIRARRDAQSERAVLEAARATLTKADDDLGRVTDLSDEKFTIDLTSIGRGQMTVRKDAGTAIVAFLNEQKTAALAQREYQLRVGTLSGFSVEFILAKTYLADRTPEFMARPELVGALRYVGTDFTLTTQTDPLGLIKRLENLLRSVAAYRDQIVSRIKGIEESLPRIERQAKDTAWAKQAEYESATRRLNELTAALMQTPQARDGQERMASVAVEPAAGQPRAFGIPPAADPPLTSHSSDAAIKAHPDYRAAKAGDVAAAARLVPAVVRPETVQDAARRFGRDAIYVPVVAAEEAGRNAIPRAVAEYYAATTGATTAQGIIQVTRAYHTGARPMERLISRPLFDGPVERGARYVLVDDVSVMGGSLAELANHIRSGGGEVVGVVTLVNASRSGLYTPRRNQLRQIEARYGTLVRDELGIEPAALTADEAAYILNFRDADALRTAIAAAAGRRERRLLAKGIQQPPPDRLGSTAIEPDQTPPESGVFAAADASDQGSRLFSARGSRASAASSTGNRPRLRIEGADAAELLDRMAKAVEIVQRVAGPKVAIEFYDHIATGHALGPRAKADMERAVRATNNKLARTAGGFYQPGRTIFADALIGLAINDPKYDLLSTAGHEAFHHVLEALATDAERDLLYSAPELARMRAYLVRKGAMTETLAAALPDYEVAPHAFEIWRREREEGILSSSGLHIGIRRLFDRLYRIFQNVANAIKGLGYNSFEDIFERARAGDFATRPFRSGTSRAAAAQSQGNVTVDQTDTTVVSILQELARNDDLFTYPRSDATDLAQVVRDIAPRLVTEAMTPADVRDHGAVRGHMISMGDNTALVLEDDRRVWVNLQDWQPGADGSAVYQAVADYAFNTGRMFTGDPSGVNALGARRRTEAMLSSALKHGTTRHLAPDPAQKIAWSEGDDIGNIRSLMQSSAEAIASDVPEIRNASYDPEQRTFRTAAGDPATDERIAQWVENARRRGADSVGHRTVKRGILLQSILRGAGQTGGGTRQAGGGDELLVRLVAGAQRGLSGTPLERIFYSARPDEDEGNRRPLAETTERGAQPRQQTADADVGEIGGTAMPVKSNNMLAIEDLAREYLNDGGRLTRPTRIAGFLRGKLGREPTGAEINTFIAAGQAETARRAQERQQQQQDAEARTRTTPLSEAEISERDRIVAELQKHGYDDAIEELDEDERQTQSGLNRLRAMLDYAEDEQRRELEEREEEEARRAEQRARRDWIRATAERLTAEAEARGAMVERSRSGVSEATYLEITPSADSPGGDRIIKVRIADHDPRPTYEALHGAADIMLGAHQAAHLGGFGEDVEAAVAWLDTKLGPPRQRAEDSDASTGDAASEVQTDRLASVGIDTDRLPALEQSVAHDRVSRLLGLADRARVYLQDRALPIRRIQEQIEAVTGKPLPLPLNVYLAEALYYGRAGEQVADLQAKYVEPLLALLRENNLTIEQIGDYLYARHAKERNEHVGAMHPADSDFSRAIEDHDIVGASGMSTNEAAEIIRRAENGPHSQAYRDAANIVDTMLRETREVLYASGLIDEDTYRDWSRYNHYVPLRGFEVGDETAAPERPHTGRGFVVRGPEARQALGRRSKADNPVLYAVMQAEQAIIRAEKARVGRTLYRLVRTHPNPDLWNVYRGEFQRFFNQQTGLVEKKWRPPQTFLGNDNDLFATKIGGKTVYLEIKHPGLLRAMRGTGSELQGTILGRGMLKLARTYAALLTSYNPEFVVSNYFRDLETALINVTDVAEKPEGIRRQIVKDALSAKAIRGILSALRGEGRAEYAPWFEEYRHAGGKISFIAANDIEQIRSRIKRALTAGHTLRMLQAAGKLIEDLNAAVENGVRLSTYIALRKAGVPQDRAAFIARELTVNFNRKGEWGPALNAAYLFFNASAQGIIRIAQAVRRSKAVRYMVAGIFALGMAMEFLNAMLAGDDDDGENAYDKIKDWVKERNLIIMLGGKDYILIPLAYGFNAPYFAGQQVAAVLRGRKAPLAAAGNVATAFFEAFNPVGSAASPIQFASPTFLDPIVQVAENKNWFGGPIYPTKVNKNKPDSETYFATAPWWAVEAARYLNTVTGGNIGRPGLIDVSPETIEHYIDFAGGGLSKFVLRSIRTGEKLVTGQEWLPEETPIVRRLYGKTTAISRRREFFEAWNEIEAARYEVNTLRSSGNRDEFAHARTKYQAELRAYPPMNEAYETLRRLRKERDAVTMNRSLSDDARRAKIEDIIRRENSRIVRALTIYNTLKKEHRQPQ